MRIADLLTERGSKAAPPTTSTPPQADEVFGINFLRGQTTTRRLRGVLLAASIAWLTANAVVIGLLTVSGLRAIRERFSLPAGQAAASPQAVSEMAALHARAQQRLAPLNAMLAVQREELPLGGKLATVTRTLPARTWLTEVSAERERRTLKLRAAYLVDPAKPYDLPTTAWIAALKADPVFGAHLTRLEPGASARQLQGRAELYTFELIAEWAGAS